MKPFNDFLTFIYRIILIYMVFMLCRVVFYMFNSELIGTISWSELPQLLKGALLFDSGSVFYINMPFLLFSLLPFKFRKHEWYQTFLLWLFVVVNGVGLLLNMADTFYYPYKLARIASDDIHFTTNGNFGTLMGGFIAEFWYGFIIWGALVALLWWGFKRIGYRATQIKSRVVYYLSQTLILACSVVISIILIRGGNISSATYPITLSDATLYAEPTKTGLILSNPFALIRTMNQKVSYPEFFSDQELETIFTPIHQPADSSHIKIEGKPNVVLIILESFASAHIKSISDQFDPNTPSYTPFLDSLMGEGYAFKNAYHNGIRSIDALPSLWSSIPSFKTQFLSLPQSMAEMESLPLALREMGYSTAFMHGAVRESMSFVAFGKSVGVETFFSREEYESENGTGDFDGKWGIWDHKFFPFVAKKINTLSQPFFATMFSLSSHHPFILPKGFEGRFAEGTLPLHHMMSYSDNALREMFKEMSKKDWYENTIFIVTADHGSGADNDKYRKVPYNFAVPLLIYSPKGVLKGSDTRVAAHIDVMPTMLGLLGYNKPYFAFGKDLFDNTGSGYTMNYMGAFNTIGDSTVYIFNEREFSDVHNYIKDPFSEHNIGAEIEDSSCAVRWTKAFVQQYYKHIKNRDYVVK